MGSTEIVLTPAVIPSKWEIIPIHASDVSSYKRCRRYWDWTSPTRTNLRRRVDVSGVKMELWFGTGIHYALEMYYNPVLQRDPVESFTTWFELQWNGGRVGPEFLDRTYDINPRVLTSADISATPTYGILGLKDLLPNVEVVEEEFMIHRELGINMLKFYKEWAQKNDDFVTVSAEDVFSIPLGFEAIDRREDSPNYGKKLEVHARGKRDAVIYWPEYDRYGINDHKSAARIDEDYFVKLEKDEQCSTYLWATIIEAQEQERPWSGKLVDRVLYTALRKNYPKSPTPTYGGKALSLDRTKEATTAHMFKEAVAADPVLTEWFLNNERAQNYYTYLCDSGDDMFVLRNVARRNHYELVNTGKHLTMIAKEMLDPDLNIYPNPTGSWLCTGCAFRVPCIAADDGSDWQGILADGYEINRDR
jgi:PD-(D/E)XK nuclease superfamily protein